MEDAAIVELYLKRDESAIAATERKYGLRLRKLALGVLGDPGTAEECENDTYLRAWERIPPHEPRDCLFPFLGRITRHLAIDRLRHIEMIPVSVYLHRVPHMRVRVAESVYVIALYSYLI